MAARVRAGESMQITGPLEGSARLVHLATSNWLRRETGLPVRVSIEAGAMLRGRQQLNSPQLAPRERRSTESALAMWREVLGHLLV